MKKILIAFDGLSYSEDFAAFAIKIAKASNSLLVGVFLRNPKKNHNSIERFTNQCVESGIYFKVHVNKGVLLSELLHESTFADLIMIDTQTNLFNLNDHKVSSVLKDLLIEASCPVLIVPKITKEIKNVFIAYDGSESSVLAMKMFSYLFPEWNELNTTILSVSKSSSNHLPKNSNIKDLSKQHFKNMKYKVLNGDASEVLIDYLKKNNEQSVVVMGS